MHIKMRKRGTKAWYFLTPRGGGNRLRVHASIIDPAKVEALVATLTAENPELEFKESK